jgi:hypothetical protein
MRSAARILARLVIALGIILSGAIVPSTIALGQRADSLIATSMSIMPGMDMGSGKHAPDKEAPCSGMDCGCCIGGACAAAFTCHVELVVLRGLASAKTAYNGAVLSGISFPPDIRPPIWHAILTRG